MSAPTPEQTAAWYRLQAALAQVDKRNPAAELPFDATITAHGAFEVPLAPPDDDDLSDIELTALHAGIPLPRWKVREAAR